MKYIKTLEIFNDLLKNKTNKPNFKVGDTVISIKGSSFTEENEKYIIDDIFQDDSGVYFCRLKNVFRDVRAREPLVFYCVRFISEVEYQSNKYNL